MRPLTCQRLTVPSSKLRVSFRPNLDSSSRLAPLPRLSAPRVPAHWRRLEHTIPPSPSRPRHQPLTSSYTPFVLIAAVACGSAVLVEYIAGDHIFGTSAPPQDKPQASDSLPKPPSDSSDPFFSEMPTPSGHVGNLTPEQEATLREMWAVTLQTFGVQDPSHPNGSIRQQVDETPPASEAEVKDKKKGKKRISLFGKKHDDSASSNGTSSAHKDPSKHSGDDDDKYGQAKEVQQILATQTPESLRTAFWEMVKADHPDGLLLRFLRARKWDVDKALVMLISTMSWRKTEMHVDDDVMNKGEIGALRDSQSSDPNIKKEGQDFLTQMRMGKSFLHGTDKEGRPLCFVRTRLHHGGDQTEKSMERYTVYVIETARLALRAPVETACIVFDMTHFTMANMDYTPVKFMIKVFEANYPESLGAVLVHKAPWIFQGIWKIIKGWLDPVVAGKVHFTSGVEDLQNYIPKSQIIKELGGEEDWEYKYVEPNPNDDDAMKDEASKNKLQEERQVDVLEYQKKTFDWIAVGSGPGGDKIKSERNDLARKLNENYWQLDPYIRSRTLYDRTGMIQKGGKINFYPNKSAVPNGNAGQASIPTHADDVD